jgi:hypothetical protein
MSNLGSKKSAARPCGGEVLPRVLLKITVIVVVCALGLQLYRTVVWTIANGGTPWGGLIRVLSYYSVLTNLMVAAFIAVVLSARSGGTPRPNAAAAVALNIGIVGFVGVAELAFSLLLPDLREVPSGTKLVADIGLHVMTPILFFSYWLLFVPRGALRWINPIYWMVYPIAYLGVALCFGSVDGYYPYPLVDVGVRGYPQVLTNAVLLLIGFLGLGFVMVSIDRAFASVGPKSAVAS